MFALGKKISVLCETKLTGHKIEGISGDDVTWSGQEKIQDNTFYRVPSHESEQISHSRNETKEVTDRCKF